MSVTWRTTVSKVVWRSVEDPTITWLVDITGAPTGGGSPTGGAGGALSGEYPNPGLNTEAVQDLVGGMAGDGLTYDDTVGELRVTGRTTPADMDDQINAYHLPFNAMIRVPVPVSNFGGTIGGGTANVSAFATLPVGRSAWFAGEVDPDDAGFYRSDGDGDFTRNAVQPAADLAYVGREVVVGTDLEFGGPSLWVITTPDGSEIVPVRSALRPDEIADAYQPIGDYALASDVAALTDADIAYDGTGLFDIAGTVGQGINAAEGALDRWAFVSAYATTNVDLSALVGVGSVANQPTLDDGIAPPEDTYCDVWLFGQTTTSENGQYLVDGGTGVWTKYADPVQFEPGNGHRVSCTANGAQFIFLDDGVVANVARARRASDFAEAAERSGGGQWYRLPDASTTLTTSPGGGGVTLPIATSDVTGLDTALAGKAAASHTHAQSDITNLTTDLAAKVPTSRTIGGVDLSANRSLSEIGTSPPPRLTVSGQYTGSTNLASTTSGLTSNRLYYVPIHIPRDLTITRIGVNQVATGSAGASSVGRFGIYANTSDLPAAAFDRPAGTIDLTTGTGIKYVSGSWALTAGIWWFAFVAQVTSGSPTFGTAAPAIVVPSSDTTSNGTKFEAGVTGTLPATATPGAANTTSPPIIFLYV